MTHSVDDTLRDLDRRDLDLSTRKIKEVLPEFFRESYPKLITLLDEYYHFEDSSGSPSRLADDLFYSRDITQTDIDLLSYIEDELLLGAAYFEGFADKRAAAKYSNVLYRSKGTKYSIQQFFRTFFDVDPDIVYTKENVFNLNDSASQVGVNSNRFLTDDKLYQTYALQIKTELSTDKWLDVYKLFAHPAGMYVGSSVQLVSVAEDAIIAPLVLDESSPPIVLNALATSAFSAVSDITAMIDDEYVDSAGVFARYKSYSFDIFDAAGFGDSDYTIQDLENQYQSIRGALLAGSPTMDDSDMDFSNNFYFETIDQGKHQAWSADSDVYYKSQIDSAGHL